MLVIPCTRIKWSASVAYATPALLLEHVGIVARGASPPRSSSGSGKVDRLLADRTSASSAGIEQRRFGGRICPVARPGT